MPLNSALPVVRQSLVPVVMAAMFAIGLPAAARGGQRDRETTQSEQSVSATRGTRLTVENMSGSISIKTWDRDSVQVRGKHTARTQVSVRERERAVHVETEAKNGGPGTADLDITMPRWMAVKIEGVYADITVAGSESEIEAETVRGTISIDGGVGFVNAESVEGRVIVANARARLQVSSVNEAVEIENVEGDVEAETTNGEISLLRMKSADVRAETVNGDITWDGAVAANGHYSFVTHNGDIDVALADSASVTMTVRTYNGGFKTDLQLKGAGQAGRGRRATYTLGAGSADMEMETFGGTIRVHRPVAGGTSRER